MTIDKNEAKLYGWHHFEEFESKIDVPKSSSYFESDVFLREKQKIGSNDCSRHTIYSQKQVCVVSTI